MKKVFLCLFCVCGLQVLSSYGGEPVWQEVSRGILGVRSILFIADKPGLIYLGAERGVFKTDDYGKSWRNILKVRDGNHAINNLTLEANNKQGLYAATKSGLYYSSDGGHGWKRVFKGKNNLENDCSVVLSLPNAIVLGTQSGLFVSKDNGRLWHKATGKLGDSPVFSISYSSRAPDYITVASTQGVFRSVGAEGRWERIFIGNSGEEVIQEVIEEEERDAAEKSSKIRFLVADSTNFGLYLATNLGVYYSKDGGVNWQLLPGRGLLDNDVQSLLLSDKSELYAATKSAVFLYQGDGWRELSFNLSSSRVNNLAVDNSGSLYACTEGGLFKAGIDYSNFSKSRSVINEYSKGEPGIAEVQEAAINYAEVNPKKIALWRKFAAQKAWLPQLNVGLDRNTGDLWHWEGGSTTKVCDDELRKGRENFDWDVTLSWDLSELVWNNDQTSIDSRSKLMVELREDVLDEVNKLYFERIRIKMEMDNLQIEDRKKRFDKELRMQELTASLDGLTGGYFSHQIKINS